MQKIFPLELIKGSLHRVCNVGPGVVMQQGHLTSIGPFLEPYFSASSRTVLWSSSFTYASKWSSSISGVRPDLGVSSMSKMPFLNFVNRFRKVVSPMQSPPNTDGPRGGSSVFPLFIHIEK